MGKGSDACSDAGSDADSNASDANSLNFDADSFDSDADASDRRYNCLLLLMLPLLAGIITPGGGWPFLPLCGRQ